MPIARTAFVSVLFLSCGCSGSTETPLDETAHRLRQVGIAYHRFTTEKGRPPHNADELRGALRKLHPANGDDFLKSSRDGQPLVIIWGFNPKQPGAGQEGMVDKFNAEQAGAIFAYEQVGSDGKRYVLFTHGGTVLLPESDFRQARFIGGHKPR